VIARVLSVLLWVATAFTVAALGMRFGMRLLGVRGDTPFPALVYAFTAPIVQPFYSFFPADPRLNHRVAEAASLVAAGAIVLLALLVYVIGLLVWPRSERQTDPRPAEAETTAR
jgi:hypothetical protein